MLKKIMMILLIISCLLPTACSGRKYNPEVILNDFASSPDGEVLACGMNGVIAMTRDFKNWDYKLIDEDYSFVSVTYFKGGFILLGHDSANERKVVCNFDPESRQWTTSEYTGYTPKIETANNRLFAYELRPSVIKMSDDGITWRDTGFPSASYNATMEAEVENGPTCIFYDGSKYIVTGASNFIATSKNLSEWDFKVESQPSSRCSYGIASNGKTNVIVGDHLSLAYEDVGTDTWVTPSDVGSDISIQDIETVEDYYTIDINDVASDGRKFVAVGTRGLVLNSEDGREWTYSFIPYANDAPRINIKKVIWNGNLFACLLEDRLENKCAVYTSPDGIEWTKV